jgi:hypothetical protein
VYLEKLLLKGIVTKANRKVIAAVCLLCVSFSFFFFPNSPPRSLATKFTDRKGLETQTLKRCNELVAKYFGMQGKDVIEAEMTVLGWLNFSLFTPDAHLMPHYQRLAKEIAQGDENYELDEPFADEDAR